MFSPKCVFSEMDDYAALKLVPLQLACIKTSGCTEFGPLDTKESDVQPKCVFSEMDDYAAWKLVPLQLAQLKTSRCTEFGPLQYKGK